MDIFLYNQNDLSEKIKTFFKNRRLFLNLTQKEVAKKSGVSLGSLKRFELTSEISLKSLIKIAVILEISDKLLTIFNDEHYESIDDILKQKKNTNRKRSRKNDKKD